MSSCSKCEAAGVPAPHRAARWMRVAFAGLVAAQSMILGLAVNLSPPAEPARTILHAVLAVSAVIVFALVGMPLLRAALSGARQGRIVFEQLFLAGVFGAFAASLVSSFTGAGHVYYEVAAVLLAIYTFGRILGDRRRDAAAKSARALGREFDECERVDAAGRFATVPVREVREGDIIHVRAAAGIPVDGVVIEGVAFVNEATLTGEPFPVVKRPGDGVLAGSHSVDAALRVRATAAGDQRLLDAIFSRVLAAQAMPSRIEREADRLVAWFLPAVFVISAITFCAWTAHAGWTTGLFNALAVILVACPCSMGLATPIGVWSALADLAHRGFVASSSDLVERLATVDCVFFDKTGTLGDEHVELVDFVCAPGEDRRTLLAEIAAVESASSHPIARAFRPFADGSTARDVTALPGTGVSGEVSGHSLEIGNASLLTAPAALAEQLRGAGAASHTLYILRDGSLAATALLRERLREPARQVIAELEAAGIPCTILTGDRAESAAIHDLPNLHAGLSAMEKADRVGARSLFVGDGVNDAPAMARAHASLVMATGSGVARDVAMGEIRDLRTIPYAIARCRAAVSVIRQNLLFAACYNFAGIALAAAGILHPIAAALLMLASSFTVSWRALRQPRTHLPARTEPGTALAATPQPA